jgi:porphobilinogen synthase
MEGLESKRLHSGYAHPVSRMWQSMNTELTPNNLMYPLFIIDNPDEVQPIGAMPGISRMGVNKALEHLDELVLIGLNSVLLFAVSDKPKDEMGSGGLAYDNPVVIAVKKIKERFGDKILIACDICLCPYTTNGHCGVFDMTTNEIDNTKSINLLAEMAGKVAIAGADVVAPSDMMDGRVLAIKSKLRQLGLEGKVSVLSYSSKFASSFYGPFREAAHSAPQFGDRKRYQLPLGSRGLAVRAADRDVQEGADMLMVKPGLAYLDVVREVKDRHPYHPMFVYQVSGEYAMLLHGSDKGAFDKRAIISEVMTSMRRAGADVIISYFTPVLLKWMAADQ